jgi:hypothetical protein
MILNIRAAAAAARFVSLAQKEDCDVPLSNEYAKHRISSEI